MKNSINQGKIKQESTMQFDHKTAYEIGYEALGPLMLGFCAYIREIETKYPNAALCFLARDGYLPRKCYEIIYGEKRPYLKVSRKSLAAPAYDKKDNPLSSVTIPPLCDIETLSAALKIDHDELKEFCKEKGMPANIQINRKNIANDKNTITIANHFKEKYTEYAKKQNEIYKQYLSKTVNTKEIIIVDAGWHNSIQNYLQAISPEIKFHGVYLGIYSDAKKLKSGTAQGYIFDKDSEIEYKVFSFVSVLESLLLADEGSCKEYGKIDNEPAPILQEFEYKNNAKSNKIVRAIQKAAEDYCEQNKGKVIDTNRKSYISPILKLGTKPTKKQAALIGQLDFENFHKTNIINYRGIKEYIKNPKQTKVDFYNSGWRIMFLKRLFKIPLPYNTIFKLLCKLK